MRKAGWFVIVFVVLTSVLGIALTIHDVLVELNAPNTQVRVVRRPEWPNVFLELLRNAADQSQVYPECLEVYHCRSDDWFLKCEATPELLGQMVTSWKLIPTRKNHALVRRFLDRIPSPLASPDQSNDIDYYASPNWLEGEKGHQFCLMHDKTNKSIVVQYRFNW